MVVEESDIINAYVAIHQAAIDNHLYANVEIKPVDAKKYGIIQLLVDSGAMATTCCISNF